MKGNCAKGRNILLRKYGHYTRLGLLSTGVLLLSGQRILAQALPKAGEGFTEATKIVSGYFGKGIILMYGIGAIVGIVGAIKVFNKWNNGDQDTGKTAAAWFGSCVFLVVVATVLKGFFGVQG